MGVENNIPEGWIEVNIAEIATTNDESISRDYNHLTIEYLDTGSITKNNIEGFQLFDLKEAPSRAKRLVKNGDIIYSTVRPNQEHYGYINNPKANCVVSTGFCVIRTKDSCYSKFLYHLLTQNKVRDYLHILGEQSASAYPSIKPIDIENLIINIPGEINEQKAIAKVLTAFDDKIELLQAQNKTLESMAQTIFKEWFGKYQIGDELPEGWRVGDIYNVLEVQYGYPFKSKLFNENKEGLPLIRIRDIRKGVTGFYTTEAYEEEYIISSGDVLAGMDAVFLPYLWSGGKGLLNQRACRFIPKDFVSRIFVFEFMKPHLSFYEKTKVGTTVIHLGKGDLDFIETVIPNKESLLKFKDLSTPIEEKIINNQQEIQSLTKTRDTLLPKLMSGQVRVNNIKQTANA